MNKKLLKATSVFLSAITLMSPFAPYATLVASAESTDVNTDNQNESVEIAEEDFSSFGTGDNSYELGIVPDESKIIRSTEEYLNLNGGKLNIHSSGDSILPKSVDNSQSEYFPKIDNQGSLGSCVAWANGYYQYTYTINKLMGVPTTESNTFSPKWLYNMANGGKDSGTSAEEVYKAMKEVGNVPISMVPYDDDYLSWNPTEENWKTAARYRITDYQYLEDFGGEETQITSPDDSDLELVKTALASGEILTYFTFITSWNQTKIKANSEAPENDKYVDEKAIVSQIGYKGSHRMTIVGYNDDLWIDINKNDKVDDGEMGALKIANSWGETYGNKGFMWIAYDALNDVSCVENGPAGESRTGVISSVSRIDVLPYNSQSNYFLTCKLNTKDRSQAYVYIIAEKDGTQTTYGTYPSSRYSSQFSYDGTTNANDGVMSFALDSAVPGLTPETFADYTWYVKFKDTKADGNVFTVKEVRIDDDNNNISYKSQDTYPLTFDGSELTTKFFDTTSNNIVVYYRGYKDAFLHYRVNGGAWNVQTGEDMEECYEKDGYTQKFVIPCDTLSEAEVYFTDLNGNIDDNNGQYHTVVRGLNYLITENARPAMEVKISNDFDSLTDVKKLCKFNVEVSGGYETYRYQFVYKHIPTGKITTEQYRKNFDTGISFQTLGKYEVTVNVMDFAENVASASMEITVEDLPFAFKEFSVTSASENIVAGKEILFDALTENEHINYKGPKSWSYKLIVKRDGKDYYSETVFPVNCNLGGKYSIISSPWTPSKGGTYEATISRTDDNNEYAEKTVKFVVKDKKIGDAGLDGEINSVDVLMIQSYDINLIDDTQIALDTADSNKDGIVSLRDATCIQRYSVGYSNSGSVGEVIELPDPKPIDSDTDSEQNTDTDSDDEKTNEVTFTNSLNWGGQLYCYYWSEANKNMTKWPGEPMTKGGTNEYNQTMYTFDVPREATYIIFTNGSSQTVDISYPGGSIRYYALSSTDSQGHHQVETW